MVVQVFGLSIVKEILNKNNGKIDISSEFGKGTEVIIRFNVKEANLENPFKDGTISNIVPELRKYIDSVDASEF